MRNRVLASPALAVITVNGDRLVDYARGGSAAEAVWTIGQRDGLSVQPLSPVFLHARTVADLAEMSPDFTDELDRLQSDFTRLAAADTDEAIVLVLRFTAAPPASVPSRRSLDRVRRQRN